VLQTFSKAWGMASIRLGMAFADPQIIRILNTIKYPYNLSLLTQQFALKELDNIERVENWIRNILNQKLWLMTKLQELPVIQTVYPSNANFILVKVENPVLVYKYLLDQKIIVRNRSTVSLCAGCLRITIGAENENKILVDALKHFMG
jgi:histidinol-phosphate aminotransferase